MKRRWIIILVTVPILLLLAAGALFWPASGTVDSSLLDDRKLLPDTVILNLDLEGSLELLPGEKLSLVTESRGFGLPASKLLNAHTPIEDGVEIVHERKGYFTRLKANTRVTLPPNRVYKITLTKRTTAVLVPGDRTNDSSFVHVQLTAPLSTPLSATTPNLKVKVIDEDFFGRKTRAFSF